MRQTRIVVGLGMLALALAGCQKKPGGQVVAVVNGEEITQQEVNAELQGAQIPPTADRQQVLREVLQRVVDRKLLVQKAKADGIDKSPEYLAQVRRGEEALAVSLLQNKAAKTIAIPDATAIDRFVNENPATFSQRKRYTLDQVAFPIPQNPAVLKQLQAVHTLDAVVGVISAANMKFARGTGALDTAQIPPPVAAQIAALPANEPFIVPANGQFVASVIRSVEVVPVAADQAKAAGLQLLRQRNLQAAMQTQLGAARKAAKIEYQPGFAPTAAAKGSAPK